MIDTDVEAARYAQRRLDDRLRPVDERLYQWGKWARTNQETLGWPRRTLLGRIIDEGMNGAAHAAPAPIEIPQEVAQVDQVVAQIGGIRATMLQVVYLWYPNQPPDVQRKKVRMSRYKWRNCLRETRIRVGQMLGLLT